MCVFINRQIEMTTSRILNSLVKCWGGHHLYLWIEWFLWPHVHLQLIYLHKPNQHTIFCRPPLSQHKATDCRLLCVCVCVCACVRACVHACVCVCVWYVLLYIICYKKFYFVSLQHNSLRECTLKLANQNGNKAVNHYDE